MPVKNIFYKYLFKFPDGKHKEFMVDFNSENLQSELINEDKYPDWTQLEFNQCSNCPLTSEDYLYCPVAVNLVPIIYWCEDLDSYDEIEVVVKSAERDIHASTSLQRAISSLLGLIMSSSACPRMKFLRPLARFHLPLATQEETIVRAVSMTFLKKYFENRTELNGEDILAELKQHYREVQEINRFLANRVRAAIKRDAAVNAIVLLDILSKKVSYSIDDSLEQIRYLFDPSVES